MMICLVLSIKAFFITTRGFSLEERSRSIENLFQKKILSILCCTNTLSAGLNFPVRSVILKEFMYFESINESSYRPSLIQRKPISRNLFHQICGRAGRRGYDENGYIFILTSDLVRQSIWIEDFYFRRSLDGKLHPRYDPINSAILSNYDLLEEIVLLRSLKENHRI